jgi:hypothetical protein
MKKVLCACFVMALGMCFASTAWGQAVGSFSGTVLDKTGSAIAGATVTATAQATGVSRSVKTDETGHYLIPLLPASVYTLRAEFAGFQAAESKDLRLQVDEARELNFTLSPSAVTAAVEVSASAVAVETTNASLGQVITGQEVSQLPLNGRDFVQLATLMPGTTQETTTNSFFNGAPSSEVSARGSFSLSVGGSRANSTDWLLDGNDNNELTAGGIGILSSIDDIQEFKVLTYNYSAEYGTRAGPTVLVTTKSGGNDFHGSLFEFLRNTSLDAKSFFAKSAEKFNLNQFGGSVGGPIRKSKSFFFVDGEQKFQRKGVTFTGLVPTDAMKAGDFSKDAFGVTNTGIVITNPNATGNPAFLCDASGIPLPLNGATAANPAGNGSQTPVAGSKPCNIIPAGQIPNNPSNLINPLAATLVKFYPEPNANSPPLTNFISEPVRKLDETKLDVRLDHNFSSADNAFARFSYDQAVSYVPGGGGLGNFTESNFFASNQGIQNHGRNIALSETHVFSPTTFNQVSGGYNRIFNYITSQGTGTCEAAILQIPGANLDCPANKCKQSGVSCGLTISEVLGGYFSIGDRGFSPFIGGTNIFSINDTLDLIRGKHDIKVGMSIRANQMNVKTEGFQDGFWQFSGLWTGNPEADLLLGLTSLAIHDQTFKGPTTGRRWKIYRPYVQDDWRITKDITLNLGWAWDFTSPISEVDNRQADFNPATGKFLVSGQGANKYAGIQWDKRAFEPRIGLAWKVRGSDKTAVRAGYAIFHDSSWNQGAQGLWQNPPYYDESDAFAFVFHGCTFANAACAMAGGTPAAISISPTPLSGQPGGFPPGAVPSAPNFTDFTGTIQAQNTNFKLGTVRQFNVNVEQQLPGQIVLTVGYAGSRGNHILVDGNNINLTSPSACGTAGYTLGCGRGGAAFVSPFLTAFPFSTISATTDQGIAHYDGLQIKAETKSSRHGIYALIGYTYSRTYDTGFSDGLGTNYGATYFPLPNWQNLDWALSGINLNNSFTASVIYDLPFGRGKQFGSGWNSAMNTAFANWQVTVIEKITSGFPVFIVDSNNASGTAFLNGNANSLIRPNEVSNPNQGGGGPGCPTQVHNVTNWFNPCAFAQPTGGQLGNASRAPLAGPDFVNTDFSVIKQFALPWEHMGLNFRAEFFNLFNHAQFATPNSTSSLGTPDFGVVTTNPNGTVLGSNGLGAISATVNNPRLVQFGLKLTF